MTHPLRHRASGGRSYPVTGGAREGAMMRCPRPDRPSLGRAAAAVMFLGRSAHWHTLTHVLQCFTHSLNQPQTQPQLRGSTDRFWSNQLRFLGQNLLDQPVDHSNKSNLTSQSRSFSAEDILTFLSRVFLRGLLRRGYSHSRWPQASQSFKQNRVESGI